MSVVEMKLWMQEGQVQGNPSDGGHRKGLASYLKLQTSLELATGQPVYMLDHQRGGVRRWCLILAQVAETTSSWQPPMPRGRQLALAWWQLEYIPHEAAERPGLTQEALKPHFK